MKNLIVTALLVLASAPALSEELRCQVDEAVMGGKKKAVPVAVVHGPQLVQERPVKFKGVTVSAKLNLGDEYEKRTWLKMTFDDFDSTIYDFTGSSFQLSKGTIRFQCWYE